MAEVVETRVNTRTTRVVFTWPEVEAILTAVALGLERNKFRRHDMTPLPDGTTSKVLLKQLEEGSPSYRVDRWTAVVEVVEDMEPRAEKEVRK